MNNFFELYMDSLQPRVVIWQWREHVPTHAIGDNSGLLQESVPQNFYAVPEHGEGLVWVWRGVAW